LKITYSTLKNAERLASRVAECDVMRREFDFEYPEGEDCTFGFMKMRLPVPRAVVHQQIEQDKQAALAKLRDLGFDLQDEPAKTCQT
jgi:hypothetical protein